MDEDYAFSTFPAFLNGIRFFNMPMQLPQSTVLKVFVPKCSALFLCFRCLSSGNETFDRSMSNCGWKRQLCKVSTMHKDYVNSNKSIILDNTWRKLVVGDFPQTIELPEIGADFTGILF